jgi:Protein  of unknown function (DUF3018)
MTSAPPKTSVQKVRDHRERMRRKGMRLVQFWVPDTTTPEFAAEAGRQSLLVSQSPHAKNDQDFIDSITIKWWEERE